jgi:hypothetical protein
MAAERLTIKLRNQSEFTQMEYLGGENAGGLAKPDGRETFESLKA